MEKCKSQNISIEGIDYEIPFYYYPADPSPDDVSGAIPYLVSSPYARGYFSGYEINPDEMVPMQQDSLLKGTRQFLSDNQGIIECDANGIMAYCIVKTVFEGPLVQYVLTYQEIIGEKIIFIKGAFEEYGITGIRDSNVLALWMKDHQDGSMEGWSRDPYDEKITTGALMNLSELREYDSVFQGFPLMICRELLDFLVQGRKSREKSN